MQVRDSWRQHSHRQACTWQSCRRLSRLVAVSAVARCGVQGPRLVSRLSTACTA